MNHCKTCRHFHRAEAFVPGGGFCELISTSKTGADVTESSALAKTHGDAEESWLEVLPDFGCVLHEQKTAG